MTPSSKQGVAVASLVKCDGSVFRLTDPIGYLSEQLDDIDGRDWLAGTNEHGQSVLIRASSVLADVDVSS